MILFIFTAASVTVCAAEGQQDLAVSEESTDPADSAADNSISIKALAAAITMGLAAVAGAVSMSAVISKSAESISRQPEAGETIRASLVLGLVFIETAIIYALVVAIMIIFVL